MQQDNQQGPLDWMKTVVAYAGLATVLITALGSPAVVLYFARFNIPWHFLTFQDAFAAGIIPFLTLGFLCLLLARAAKSVMLSRNLHDIPLWVPLLILPFGIWLIASYALGALSLLVGIVALLLWFFFSHLLGTLLTVHQAMVFAFGLTLISLPPAILVFVIRERRHQHRHASNEHQQQRDTVDFSLAGFESRLRPSEVQFLLVPILYATIPILSLYALKGLLFFWDEAISHSLKQLYILVPSIALALGASLAFVITRYGPVLTQSDSVHTRLAWFNIIGIGVTIYLASSAAYASDVYPRLPRFLGGGGSEPVLLRLDSPDFAHHFAEAGLFADCDKTQQGTVCKNLYLVRVSSDFIVVSDKPVPPGSTALISSDKVKLLSRR